MGTEVVEGTIGLQQGSPESAGCIRVVVVMKRVLLQWNGVRDLARCGPDLDIEPEGVQLSHYRPIELSHTAGLKVDPTRLSQAGLNHQLAINEIEDQLEQTAAMGNG